MNKSESKYFNTAVLMDKAFLELLDKKDFEYITVKEICEKAGVNRSTFYLHYETVADLLNESIEYMNRQFESYFSNSDELNPNSIATAGAEELYLITPQYLEPYLQFVKDHRKLFKTAMKKSNVLGGQKMMDGMFKQVIGPIMDRYNVPQENRLFILSYYVNGIIGGIIKLWLDNDCKEPIDFILNIIRECIKKPF